MKQDSRSIATFATGQEQAESSAYLPEAPIAGSSHIQYEDPFTKYRSGEYQPITEISPALSYLQLHEGDHEYKRERDKLPPALQTPIPSPLLISLSLPEDQLIPKYPPPPSLPTSLLTNMSLTGDQISALVTAAIRTNSDAIGKAPEQKPFSG